MIVLDGILRYYTLRDSSRVVDLVAEGRSAYFW